LDHFDTREQKWKTDYEQSSGIVRGR
jgi:hypothetical protein